MTDMHGLKPNVWPNTPYNVTAQIRGDIREIVQREIEQVTIGTIGAETPAGAQEKVDTSAASLTAAIAAAKAELQAADALLAPLVHTHDDRYYLKAQVDSSLAGKAAISHAHDDRYYTESEVDAALAGKAATSHSHNEQYYTEDEIDTALAGKANTSHTHDDRYYTEAQTNNLLATKASTSHTHDDRYFTEAEVTSALAGKAPLVHDHNDRYYTEAEIDALIADVSGNAGWTPVNATTTTKGIVELATTTEATTGTDTTRATTPAGVKAALDAKAASDMSTYATKDELSGASSIFGNVEVEEVRDAATGTTWWITHINKTTFSGTSLLPRAIATTDPVTDSANYPSLLEYVAANDCVVAINASTEVPLGHIIIDGEIVRTNTTGMYVLGIFEDGALKAYAPDVTPAAIIADGARDGITAFAPLVVDGVAVNSSVWAATTTHYAEAHPRQIIGQHTNGDYFIATCDGRTTGEAGVTLAQALTFIQSQFRPWFAYNLDGGGSTQTFIGKKRVNRLIEDRPRPTIIEFVEVGAAVPEPPDEAAPTAGTLSVASQTATSISVTVAGATDETALDANPYAFSSNGGATYSAWQSSTSHQFTSLTASTSYNLRHKVRDAAGNETQGTVVPHSTDAHSDDSTNPTPGTLAASLVTDTSFTLTVTGASDETALDATPYSFTTDGGSTWTAYQESASLAVTGKTAETGYTCQHKVKDAAGNISTGTAITVTTSAATAGALTFLQAANTDTDASTYTFSGQNLGAASSDRVIFISVGARLGGTANYTISSVTVGGVTATIDKQYWYQANASGIARVAVPTGVTGDVVVTFSTVMGRCGIALWSYSGGTVSVSTTAQDGNEAPDDSVSLSITGAAGGFVLATSSFLATAGGTPASCVWTGITERFDQAIEVTTGNIGHSGGDTTDSGALTITGAWTPVDNVSRRHASCAVAYAVS